MNKFILCIKILPALIFYVFILVPVVALFWCSNLLLFVARTIMAELVKWRHEL